MQDSKGEWKKNCSHIHDFTKCSSLIRFLKCSTKSHHQDLFRLYRNPISIILSYKFTIPFKVINFTNKKTVCGVSSLFTQHLNMTNFHYIDEKKIIPLNWIYFGRFYHCQVYRTISFTVNNFFLFISVCSFNLD